MSVFKIYFIIFSIFYKKIQNKAGSNYFNSNEFKNSIKHNLSNQSLEININTQYSKKNAGSMSKKMNELKKHYVSPYSQKIISNNLKI